MGKTSRYVGIAAVAVAASLSLSACGGGSGNDMASDPAAAFDSPNSNPVTVLIGGSGEAETKSVKDAVAAWSKTSGIAAEVVFAPDLQKQAVQSFASGNPADVVYVSTESFAGWAANGSLVAYGDRLQNRDDFFPTLLEAFTTEDKLFCAPKDFSTLALVINTKMWKKAGLTADDLPTNWEQLYDVSKKLTKGRRVGLSFSPDITRVGAFLAQNGGALVSPDGATATANSPENVAALTFVKKMLSDGVAAYSTALGADWGGEALGGGSAAMVIEGNWIVGFMATEHKGMEYTIAKLPAGTQPGTLEFTNCWGISADGDNKGGALSLVQFLTSTSQQLEFADDFGVMPSVKSAAAGYKKAFPRMVPFLQSAKFAQNLPAMEGAAEVLTELNDELEQLGVKEPQAILDAAQANFEAIVG